MIQILIVYTCEDLDLIHFLNWKILWSVISLAKFYVNLGSGCEDNLHYSVGQMNHWLPAQNRKHLTYKVLVSVPWKQMKSLILSLHLNMNRI